MKSFVAGKNDNGVRLLRFCEKVCPTMPKGLLHKAFRNKRIKINGKKQDENYRLKQGDVLELYINDEFFIVKPTFKTVDYSTLSILFEDDNILIAIKPFGLLCHSDNKDENNLIDMILSYLYDKKNYFPDSENSFTPALCNRIDQGTEGLVIAAKNYTALTEINTIIRENLLEKKYICITQNNIENGIYKAFLRRDLHTKKVTVSDKELYESKEIITGFKTLKSNGKFNLIECELITGRTHQIRAHLSFLNAPIIGDKKYGHSFKNLDSQLLCAYKIKFNNIPEDFTVSYLSNKEFIYENNSVVKFFNNL